LKVEQALGRIDDEDAGRDVHLGDDRLDERDQDLLGPSAGGAGRPGQRGARASQYDRRTPRTSITPCSSSLPPCAAMRKS